MGPQVTQEEEEKEGYQDAFNRLWAEIGTLTEEEFNRRLAELSSIGDEEARRGLSLGPCCSDGACDLCAFLDSLDEPAPAGAASLDYEGLGEFESSYWQHRNAGSPRRSDSAASGQ